jgi:hypothetical protein
MDMFGWLAEQWICLAGWLNNEYVWLVVEQWF